MQRIHTFSSMPTVQSRCSSSWRNNCSTGHCRSIVVQIVQIIDNVGLEIANPSPNDGERTSYVMISRGKSRFVDEIHIPNAELRSTLQLLSERQKSEGGDLA